MRRIFLDASAVVPMLLEERHTAAALEVWRESEQAWSWDWMPVEADAALTRRRANASVWRGWRELEMRVNRVGLESGDYSVFRSMNRQMGLRAADAGYVFLFERLCAHLSDLALVTFDQETARAAKEMGLPVYSACDQS